MTQPCIMIGKVGSDGKFRSLFLSLYGIGSALAGLLLAVLPIKAGTNLDWNELQNGRGPVVFLVNGYWGCSPCISRTLHDRLKSNGIAVYDFDWNDIYRQTQLENFNLADAEFLRQMEGVINAVPQSRPIVLIGHSFGGDSSLKAAQRTSRRIELLGVLDGVELGGIRTGRSVRSNVGYFYNRWTSNPSGLRIPGIPLGPGIPLNPGTSGAVSCSARTCDQKEQSYGYNADGSADRDNCARYEFTCPGYEPWPGGSNGTKHKRITHGGDNAIYKDQLIQQELLQLILSLQVANDPRKPANRYGLTCISNETNSPITYIYRWGDSRWSNETIQPGTYKAHYWPYKSDNENRSPWLEVKFDYDLSSRESGTDKYYRLASWASPGIDCNLVQRKEVFRAIGNQQIDLFRQ
jgi:pimeloyl-ACP methyl ester carboxylesterase